MEGPAALRARGELVRLLQLAYSGELGAIRAYLGHRAALRDRAERADLGRITREEIRHRHSVGAMLAELGTGPDPRRERKLNFVGRSIAAFCAVGGWFLPMYGAGKLERDNVGEYEHAARLAHVAGLDRYVEPLLEMAEVEHDHEKWFRAKASSHPLWHVLPRFLWPPLGARDEIRASYAAFVAAGAPQVAAVVPAWIVR